MRGDSGQATVEWVGLVLLAALALGGLAAAAAGRAPEEDRELGAALASRLAGPATGRRAGPASGLQAGPASGLQAGPATSLPAAAPPVPAPRANRAIRAARAKAVNAFRSLRGLGRVSNSLWIVCLGYRRYVFEREHPRAPLAPMPVEEALDVADTCLNPLNFLGDD